jgi:hypothetical protein
MLPLLTLLELCPLVVTFGYVLLCVASPWGTCQRCYGHGRTCTRCNATGLRPRIGWQLYAYARRLYRDGTR